MKRHQSRTLILIGLIVLVAALIEFTPYYGWRIRQFLSPRPLSGDTDTALRAENETLKAELAKFQNIAAEVGRTPPAYIRAMVYSRYPLNFKSELLVDVGSSAGIKAGAAVVSNGVFLGLVEKTFPDSSLVRTVFDNGLKLPVRIGAKGYDGLLEGGSAPTVTSIAKTAVLTTGDIVFASAPGIPYGLPVGEVAATNISPDSLFEEASLDVAYNIDDIESVMIAP